MKSVLKGIGIAFLITGSLSLVIGIIMALTVGTYLVPIFLTSSMLINTAGIVLMKYGGK